MKLSIDKMELEKKSLLKARNQWLRDIKMYKDFLKGEPQTFEEQYGAKEYISMAEHRLKDINEKLEMIDKEQFLV